MLKKIGIPILTLAAMFLLVPAPQAQAGVRIGVAIGGPAVVVPAAPVYVAPPPVYPAPLYPAYPYPAPVYVAPSVTFGWGPHAYVGPGRYFGHGFVGHGFRGRR